MWRDYGAVNLRREYGAVKLWRQYHAVNCGEGTVVLKFAEIKLL